jgi:hypothetical protein
VLGKVVEWACFRMGERKGASRGLLLHMDSTDGSSLPISSQKNVIVPALGSFQLLPGLRPTLIELLEPSACWFCSSCVE